MTTHDHPHPHPHAHDHAHDHAPRPMIHAVDAQWVMDGASLPGQVILANKPAQPLVPPDALAFHPGRDPNAPPRDFLPGPDIAHLATELIQRHHDLFHSIPDYTVAFLWKRSGGTRNGKAVFGRCQKLGGVAKHFADADYLIWLAADHARDAALSPLQLEALLFHELCHIEPSPEPGAAPGVRPHDAELFLEELLRYGLWQPDLRDVAQTVRQLPLDLDGPARDPIAPPLTARGESAASIAPTAPTASSED